MLESVRYYWIAARGYRLRPWASPYLRWRFETFLGGEASALDRKKFLRIAWKYRASLKSFAEWAATRRQEMRR